MSNATTSGLSVKAIFLSIVLHLLVLTLFVFVMPSSSVPHKPQLVFFGPILKTSELSVFASARENLSDGKLLPSTPVKFSTPKPPYADRAVPKPTFQEGIFAGAQQKITPRKAVSAGEMPVSVGSSGEDLDLPPMIEYQPLRFYNK